MRTASMRSTTVADLLIALLLVSVSDAFIWPKWGRCPKVTVEQQFDLESYLGTWYEQAGHNTEMFQGDVRCARADYLPTGDGKSGVINVHNQAISQRTNKPVSINGTAVLTDPSKNEGRLTVRFHVFWIFPVKGDYWVLGTDYDTYSVVYSCHNLLFLHYDTVWALGRSQTFDSEEDEDDFYTAVFKLLWANRISDYLTKSNQTNCDV